MKISLKTVVIWNEYKNSVELMRCQPSIQQNLSSLFLTFKYGLHCFSVFWFSDDNYLHFHVLWTMQISSTRCELEGRWSDILHTKASFSRIVKQYIFHAFPPLSCSPLWCLTWHKHFYSVMCHISNYERYWGMNKMPNKWYPSLYRVIK